MTPTDPQLRARLTARRRHRPARHVRGGRARTGLARTGPVTLLALVALLAGACAGPADEGDAGSGDTTDEAPSDTDDAADSTGSDSDGSDDGSNDGSDDAGGSAGDGEDDGGADGAGDPSARAHEILDALAEPRPDALADMAHPEKGVRFSPYANVDEDEHVVMHGEALADAMEDDEAYVWGTWDGRGGPIELTFAEYHEEFIWDVDFRQADEVTVDEPQQRGNMVDNSQEAYPDAHIVEYYVEGEDPEVEGMDWRVLRLALEEHEGELRLVGVIHSEWTT